MTAARCSNGASAMWSVATTHGANVYPRKSPPEQKIHAAVALIMASARCMAAKPPASVYEMRELIFVG